MSLWQYFFLIALLPSIPHMKKWTANIWFFVFALVAFASTAAGNIQ